MSQQTSKEILALVIECQDLFFSPLCKLPELLISLVKLEIVMSKSAPVLSGHFVVAVSCCFAVVVVDLWIFL